MKITDVEKMLRPLRTKIAGMIVRGVVKAVNDSGGVQLLKISALADEVKDNVERVQQYGFTSNPKRGSESVAIAIGGNRGHLLIISVDDRSARPKDLAEGETALWSDFGDRVWLRNGKILVGATGANDPVARKSDLQALADAFNGHTHSVPGSGLTAPSGGGPVTGSATTAAGPNHTATGSTKVMVDG